MCAFLFSSGLLINGLHTAPEPPQQLHSSQPTWSYPHPSLTLKMTPPTHTQSPIPSPIVSPLPPKPCPSLGPNPGLQSNTDPPTLRSPSFRFSRRVLPS